MQHLIGIDSGGNQRVVLIGGHGEDQSMRYDRTLSLRGKFSEMTLPRFGGAALALVVGKTRGSRTGTVGVDANEVVKKSSDMNLAKRFL
ncbi:MAG: hypothetical protein J0I10_02045 [Verrucomicrobia bacterium]|nr:hypothetical protein [Verrucomicrobiota bacterium]